MATAPATGGLSTHAAIAEPQRHAAVHDPEGDKLSAPRTRSAAARADGPVVAAVRRDLAALAERAPDLAESGLAAAAISLALELDVSISSHGKAQAAKALLDITNRLFDLAPAVEEHDDLHDLRARRAARLEGGTEAHA